MIARVSEVAGIDMRVFPRDTNLDIMSEFLNKGEHQSIPTMVFYTADQQYLFHWIERPALANQETTEIDKEIESSMAGQDEQDIRRARRERINARFPDWQKETVRELRLLLEEKLGT